MHGLVIKGKWLDLIMSGSKTLEIRGANTTKVGQTIYLLESKTNKVRGTCKITSSNSLTEDSWIASQDKHKVSITFDELRDRYRKPCAWGLGDVTPVTSETYYNHPKGAITWVKDVENLIVK